MTIRNLIGLVAAVAALGVTLGCEDVRQVRTARAYGMVDTIPDRSSKGYVEFVAKEDHAVVPIYQADGPGRPKVVGAVGLNEGDRYSRVRYKTDVSRKLRVAVSPGMHTFTIEKDGERFRVPVEEGKVTPVEVDYTLLDRTPTLDVYRAETEILPIVTAAEPTTKTK